MSEEEYSLLEYGKSERNSCAVRCAIGAGILVIGLVVGILIGLAVTKDGNELPSFIAKDGDPSLSQKIIDGIKLAKIRDNLISYTAIPRLAGTEGSRALARELADQWRGQGLDHVTEVKYDVLLSYPNMTDLSRIHLIDDSGRIQYRSSTVEHAYRTGQDRHDIVRPFNTYSATGDVQGDLVYVNYGRLEDFSLLNRTYGIDLTGKLAIVKYGQISRVNKALLAEEHGAKGLILYTDPADYVGQNRTYVYPNTWLMPPSGVQRGSVLRVSGDPTTPGYPALDTAFREDTMNSLPSIPVHPISYEDAEVFLRSLGGEEVPKSWRGGLNVTYRFGGKLDNPGWTVQMHVTTHTKMASIANVFGIIQSDVEPDRYVMLGNHRDAWVYGGLDPNSGTAVMMEVSRVMAEQVKQGWRPRRSLLFCSWDAEEYGQIGSWEWAEEYIRTLSGRAVAYLNVDTAVSGTFRPSVSAMPLLHDVIYKAAKKISSPNLDGQSLYDEWLARNSDPEDKSSPRIELLGAATDHVAFQTMMGVPSMTFGYVADPGLGLYQFPLYHSLYDDYYHVDVLVDPDYSHLVAVGQWWGEMARMLADDYKLPLDVVNYASNLMFYATSLDKEYGKDMRNHNVAIDELYVAVEIFQSAAENFLQRLNNANLNNPVEVRIMNDQMMKVEMAFMDPIGLPSRPYYKHLLFAPDKHDSYEGVIFPGFVDLMFEIRNNVTDPDTTWREVKRHLATVIFAVRSATVALQPPENFIQKTI